MISRKKIKNKKNKFVYGWKFLVNYGHGWEYETFELDRKSMLENKKAYSENCLYPFRIVRSRIENN